LSDLQSVVWNITPTQVQNNIILHALYFILPVSKGIGIFVSLFTVNNKKYNNLIECVHYFRQDFVIAAPISNNNAIYTKNS